MKKIAALLIAGLGIQLSWTIENPSIITQFNVYKGTYVENGPTQLKKIATVKRTGLGPRFYFNYQLKDTKAQLFGVSAVDKGGRESLIKTKQDDGTPVVFREPAVPGSMTIAKQSPP